jgi:uncharacterized RDD family membrane protein YckC
MRATGADRAARGAGKALEAATVVSRAPAQFATRFAAQFLDAIAITGVSLAITQLGGRSALSLAIASALTAAYYTFSEGLTGQTFGKRLLHIKVVDDATGKPIGPPRALLRFIVSWVSFIVLLGGYFWMLGNDAGQTWHDQAARSLVINV